MKSRKLTDEEKRRFAPMLQQTYCAIADDAGRLSRRAIVEVTCDANRPEQYGGMSREDYQILCDAYNHRDTQRWLRQTLNY